MTTKRQFIILNYVVKEFTKYGSPVSSQQLWENHKDSINISAPSIRNEMRSLEKDGYLEKGYKKSGSIPTTKGYEHYLHSIKNNPNSVDNLIKRLDKIFEDRVENIDKVLSNALKLINEATNTLTITKENMKGVVEDIKCYDLKNNSVMILVVDTNGGVYNKKAVIPSITKKDLEIVFKIFSDRLIGTKIEDLEKKASQLEEIIFTEIHGLESKYQELVRSMFNQLIRNQFSHHGFNSLVRSENLNVEQLDKIFSTIESKTIWSLLEESKILKLKEGKTQVILDVDSLDKISVVNRKIKYGDNREKQLTFIGAKNLNYEKLFTLMNEVDKKIKDE